MRDKDRMNRVPIELAKYITSNQYVILDYILFRSALPNWELHWTNILKETGMDTKGLRKAIASFPFLTRIGKPKGRTTYWTLDYAAFLKWMAFILTNESVLGHSESVLGNSTQNNKHKNTKDLDPIDPTDPIDPNRKVIGNQDLDGLAVSWEAMFNISQNKAGEVNNIEPPSNPNDETIDLLAIQYAQKQYGKTWSELETDQKKGLRLWVSTNKTKLSL